MSVPGNPSGPRGKVARVLAIAGSDSGGGAGLQADVRTITLLGGHAMTAVTAVTAQNTVGVERVEVLAPEMVLAQVDAVVGDIGVDAVKVGMLGSPANAEAVAARLAAPDLAELPVVFDPVMVATSGALLADAATRAGFARLLARATVTTPNLDELTALAGLLADDEIAIGKAAAHLIEAAGARAILATGARLPGGLIRHADGREQPTDPLLFDLLFWQEEGGLHQISWDAERIDTDQDHGTGCTLSSAIATGLGQGTGLPDAIGRARDHVRAALLGAPGLGRGHGPMGPGVRLPNALR